MIIVTGASGFIGSNLIKGLIDRGEKDILAVDYVMRDYIKDLPVLFTYADEFISHIDKYVKDRDNLRIFHEGAISSTTETDKKKLFKQNIEYTYKLMYYCRDKGIPMQYASSASVYGNPTREEWDNPNKKFDPLNLYAHSKRECDYIADMIINSKMPPVLLQGMRYFNVYGPNEDHKGDQSSPHHKFRKQFEETGKIRLFEGSKEFLRDFVSVEEIVEKKLQCFQNKSSGFYDVGTAKPKSFYDVALEIGGSDDVIEWVPMPEILREHYQKYTCAIMDW